MRKIVVIIFGSFNYFSYISRVIEWESSHQYINPFKNKDK